MNFKEIGLSEKVLKALNEIGYDKATEIQEKAIPVIINGKDIIGQSQTGTGKTASFALPIIDNIDINSKSVQAIILCPTRELAVQAADEIKKFTKYINQINTLAVYGGQDIRRQIEGLRRGAQIIVGTPGRVMDHMRRKSLKLDNVSMVVLDEADEMLSMGFEEDIETILKEVPEKRQTILFSATMNSKILKITKKYLTDPVEIKIKANSLTVDKIKQIAFEAKSRNKDEYLERVLDFYAPNSSIVFCNTKRKTDEVTELLKICGYKAESIHGDVKQNQRDRIIKDMKNNKFKILVATDVAARGLDIKDLDMVINYDIPLEDEYYVHRIGRTGRNGENGIAITFVTPREMSRIKMLERFAKTTIKFEPIPDASIIENKKSKELVDKIQKVIDKNNFENEEIINELLSNNNDMEKIAKALISIIIEKAKPKAKKEVIVNFDPESEKLGKIFINVGKKDKVSAKDIIGSITAYSDIAGKDIGKVSLMDKFSFVEIPEKHIKNVITSMEGKQIKKRKVNVEIANS